MSRHTIATTPAPLPPVGALVNRTRRMNGISSEGGVVERYSPEVRDFPVLVRWPDGVYELCALGELEVVPERWDDPELRTYSEKMNRLPIPDRLVRDVMGEAA